MSTGADAKTMPQTREFDENHERIFGKDRKPVRGRWVWDDAAGRLVPADEYQALARAIDAPIMVDRFMEGAQATDGTDIGSRRKREEYKRREGATDKSDYGPGWAERKRAERERAASEATRRSVAEITKIDTRHLPRFLEEKK